MFYYFFIPLIESLNFLNLFKYITFRAGGALFTSLIKSLKKIQKNGQPIRKDGPKSHLINKAGTPTMGGTLILISLITSTLLWANLSNILVWLVLFITLSFGIISEKSYYRLSRK